MPKKIQIIPDDNHVNPIHMFYNKKHMNNEPYLTQNKNGTYSVHLTRPLRKNRTSSEERKLGLHTRRFSMSNMARKGGRRRKTAKKSRNSKR
jgi:hypothetical protein